MSHNDRETCPTCGHFHPLGTACPLTTVPAEFLGGDGTATFTTWTCSPRLRYIRRFRPITDINGNSYGHEELPPALQQLWVCWEDGTEEWRNVPIENP